MAGQKQSGKASPAFVLPSHKLAFPFEGLRPEYQSRFLSAGELQSLQDDLFPGGFDAIAVAGDPQQYDLYSGAVLRAVFDVSEGEFDKMAVPDITSMVDLAMDLVIYPTYKLVGLVDRQDKSDKDGWPVTEFAFLDGARCALRPLTGKANAMYHEYGGAGSLKAMHFIMAFVSGMSEQALVDLPVPDYYMVRQAARGFLHQPAASYQKTT